MSDQLPKLPMYDAMKRYQQEVLENGYLFPLTATSIGMPEVLQARVRRLSTVDRAAINALPQDMRETIFRGIRELQAEQKKAGDTEPENMLEMLAQSDSILATANAWCQAAFIYPRIVERPDQVRGEEGVWALDAIHEEDRIALLLSALDADSVQTRKLKLFRPQWGHAATNGETVPVAATTERTLEVVGAGTES